MFTAPASPFVIHPEGQVALLEARPVVALESTVITHGLPYPQNLQTALNMEAAVRRGGAVPATIAILSGRIHIGLTATQLEYLSRRPAGTVRKCSRRDLPLVVGLGEDGATTVAGTMILAHMAGIPIFATGGIGGVHRGHPFDVSADLLELGRTPIAVVCSGAKSILDLPLTCEVLETQGVPIVGYGTDTLPAFFSRSSGLPVTVRVETAAQVAQIIKAQEELQLQSGLLITVPVPESAALDSAEIEQAIARATREADEAGIHGPAATPWLLSRLVELTDGRTMQANTALLANNGLVAGQIAAVLRE
ncbi:MAG: pseudouridine-5'-phosphate glycosidase [Chloroflexi bacterium]|nr:pseudouridine-5'-phosphate glycosidase [Chloroflexota bacterium]